MAKKKTTNDDSSPLPEGASPVGTVDPQLADKARAEVDAARSAPRDANATSSPPTDAPPRKRGRPPGSKTRAQQLPEEPQPDPATPEQFASLVDMANMVFRANSIAPVGDEERDEWAKQAATVANRWGGQLPLMPELTLLATTGVIFGPRVMLMLSKAHKEKLAAEKRRQAERDATAKADAAIDRGAA
jgi:hypothetical protein